MKRRFNIKFFLCLLVGAVLFGLAFHGVHILRAGQISIGLLRLADQAEAEKENNKETDKTEADKSRTKAINYLQRYLKFEPKNTDALARFGLLLDEQASKSPKVRERAFYILDQVLRRDPDRKDVRRKVVDLAMSLGGYGDAKTHLDVLIAEAPTDGELLHLRGRCEVGRGKFSDAIIDFQKAIQNPPKPIESYVLMAAVLWRKNEDAKRADEIMLQMVKDKKSVPAYLKRAAYLRERSKAEPAPAEQDAHLQRAGEDIAAARQLAAESLDVLLESAEWWLAQIKPSVKNTPLFDNARSDVEQAIKLHPKEPRPYLLLSRVENLAGRAKQATASLHAGLKEVPEDQQADLLFTLADLLMDQGSLTEAEGVLARLRSRSNSAAAPIAFLDAFALVKEGKKDNWLKATRALEAVRPSLADWPQLSNRVDFLLGQCYEQLGDPDQQYAAYRRALSADPMSISALFGVGQSLIAMGRPEDAIDAYRRMVSRVPEAKLAVARLLVQRNLGLPKNQQAWDEIDTLLKDLETAIHGLPATQASGALLRECYLLNAESKAARGDLHSTEQILVQARNEQPDNVDMWLALANLAGQKPQGGLEEAQRLISEAESKFGDRVEIRLARAWQIRRAGKEPEALVPLTERMEEFKEADQIRMLRECARGCALLGDLGRADQLYRRLAELRPHDVTIKLMLFDIALETDNHSAAEKLIKEMRDIEGSSGARWRYATANRLVTRALKGGNSDRLEDARALLSTLASERPNWHRVAVTQGQLDELQNKPAAAIDHYMQAIESGDRNPAVIQHLCKLLYRAQRHADAAKVMHKLPEGYVIQGEMRQMAVDLSLRSQEYKEALVLAEKAVRENPKDYRNHLWLGQVYLTMNKQAQAEPVLREAVAVGRDVPETWVILVQYLVFMDQKDKAAAEIANAAKALSAKQAPLALAQCYVAMGDREQAQLHYQRALEQQPKDTATLQGAADFYLRTGQLKEAEKYLKAIIELKHKDEVAESAKRILAHVLAVGGANYESSREKLAELGMLADTGKTVQPGDESIEQLRAKAITLALLKHRPDRLAAIRILKQMGDRQPLTANDQFLLAQLYESVGNWADAHVQLLALVNKDGKNLSYLTRLALGLLRQGQSDAAAPLVAKMEALYPNAGAVAEIKARLMRAQGQAPQAVEVLRKYAEKNQDQSGYVAALLEDLQQKEAAESMWRQFVARSKAPEAPLALARYLGRQDRLDEALDICQKAAATVRSEVIAAASLHILYDAKTKPSREQCQRVEKLLTAAIQKERSVVLLDYLGAFHNIQENFAGAETAFRAALALDANDPTALNNLSWLLAFQAQKNAEALQLAERAIRILGPSPGVLDTRGVIHLAAGRTVEAVKDLQEVVAEGPTASHFFHLAQAHTQAKNWDGASKAMADANRLGLKESALHPLERGTYQQLCSQLGIEKK